MKKASAKSCDEIRKEVQSSKVAGADEIGVKVNGKGEWMWAFQTILATYLFADDKRGWEAIDKHFPSGLPNTALVTDRHAPCFIMNVENHQVCLAYLLRNLIFMTQLIPESDWFIRMLQFLRKAILYSIAQAARKKGDNPFEALVQIANSIV